MKRPAYVLLLILAALRCTRPEPSPTAADSLIGHWLLYETGGSPGFGYYITPIAPVPMQWISFSADGKFAKAGANLGSLFDAAFYRIDKTPSTRKLVFMATQSSSSIALVNFSVKNDRSVSALPVMKGAIMGLCGFDKQSFRHCVSNVPGARQFWWVRD